MLILDIHFILPEYMQSSANLFQPLKPDRDLVYNHLIEIVDKLLLLCDTEIRLEVKANTIQKQTSYGTLLKKQQIFIESIVNSSSKFPEGDRIQLLIESFNASKKIKQKNKSISEENIQEEESAVTKDSSIYSRDKVIDLLKNPPVKQFFARPVDALLEETPYAKLMGKLRCFQNILNLYKDAQFEDLLKKYLGFYPDKLDIKAFRKLYPLQIVCSIAIIEKGKDCFTKSELATNDLKLILDSLSQALVHKEVPKNSLRQTM